MTGEPIRLQRRHIVNDPGPQRIEVDIGHQLPEIRILFAENRLVAVLKKVTVAAVPAVEAYRVASQKPAHDRGDRTASGVQKQMGMIRHQRPCVTIRLGLRQVPRKPLEEILPAHVIDEDRSPVDSSNDDMMQSTGGIDARLAGHAVKHRINRNKPTMKQRPSAMVRVTGVVAMIRAEVFLHGRDETFVTGKPARESWSTLTPFGFRCQAKEPQHPSSRETP